MSYMQSYGKRDLNDQCSPLSCIAFQSGARGLWQACREGLAPGWGIAGASAVPWSKWRPHSSPGSAPAAGGHCSPAAARPALKRHQHIRPRALGLTVPAPEEPAAPSSQNCLGLSSYQAMCWPAGEHSCWQRTLGQRGLASAVLQSASRKLEARLVVNLLLGDGSRALAHLLLHLTCGCLVGLLQLLLLLAVAAHLRSVQGSGMGADGQLACGQPPLSPACAPAAGRTGPSMRMQCQSVKHRDSPR